MAKTGEMLIMLIMLIIWGLMGIPPLKEAHTGKAQPD